MSGGFGECKTLNIRILCHFTKLISIYLKLIVSNLLGYSSMKVTQDSYGKILEKKISEEMGRLKGRSD